MPAPAGRRRRHRFRHHEPGTSHYELLRAFADDDALRRIDAELEAWGYLTHEFGDSVFLERQNAGQPRWAHQAALVLA